MANTETVSRRIENIGREWEYLFYVDVMYDDLTRYRQSIDAIIPLTKDLTILGEYRDGKQTN